MKKNVFDSHMKSWVKMVNENTYSYNPDDYKADTLDVQSDEYEKLKNELDKYYKNVEKSGDIRGNIDDNLLFEIDDDDTKTDDTQKEKTTEAMTPDEILKQFDQHKKEIAAAQAKIAQKVKSVEIKDFYDGYVSGTAIMNDGTKNDFEFDIPEEEIKSMLDQITSKHPDKSLTIDDAAIAVIRLRFDPADKLDWFAGPAKTSLDQWFLEQEIEDDSFSTQNNPKAKWEDLMGLVVGDDGEFADDDGRDFNYDNDEIGGDEQQDSYQHFTSRWQ